MPRVLIPAGDLPAIMEEISTAILWLEPGAVQFRYCQIKNAVLSHAKTYREQEEALINDCAKFEGDGENRKRIQTVQELPNGTSRVSIQMHDQDAFAKRYKELQEQAVEIDLPVLLDFNLHIKTFTAHKVSKPPERTVDFSALMPVIKDSAVEV